jgi:GMP synthase-like glutamine amidotransferase
MKPVRLFRHANCRIPGYLCSFLENRGIPFEIACIGEGTHVPDSLNDVSGLVFMGGPGDVNSPVAWMREEQATIQKAAKHGTPVMGVCLGAQMISKALGGKVSSVYKLEVGWHHVEKTDDSEDSVWFKNLPHRFEVFQWHAHEFTLPPGATLLLTSRCTPCQAFSVGNILAMQFHLEIAAPTVPKLAQQYASDLSTPSDCVQQADELCRELDQRTDHLHLIADSIYTGWLERL